MKEEMFYIVNNVDFVYYMYVIYWYKIVLYICAIDTVLIMVSYNSVKNGNLLLYDCFICVLWPVYERWDLNKVKDWNKILIQSYVNNNLRVTTLYVDSLWETPPK